MTLKFRPAALLVALLAMLAFASTAMAKGGVDNKPCAQITSYDNTPAVFLERAAITTNYTIDMRCADERAPTVSITYRNETTGALEMTAVTVGPILARPYSTTWAPAQWGTRYTVTLTVYDPGNGRALDSRKQTITTVDQPTPTV